MPAAIVGNDAEAVLRQEMHLAVPRVGVERPAMGEGDDRAAAPVLEVDGRSVFGGYEIHGAVSLGLNWKGRVHGDSVDGLAVGGAMGRESMCSRPERRTSSAVLIAVKDAALHCGEGRR